MGDRKWPQLVLHLIPVFPSFFFFSGNPLFTAMNTEPQFFTVSEDVVPFPLLFDYPIFQKYSRSENDRAKYCEDIEYDLRIIYKRNNRNRY